MHAHCLPDEVINLVASRWGLRSLMRLVCRRWYSACTPKQEGVGLLALREPGTWQTVVSGAALLQSIALTGLRANRSFFRFGTAIKIKFLCSVFANRLGMGLPPSTMFSVLLVWIRTNVSFNATTLQVFCKNEEGSIIYDATKTMREKRWVQPLVELMLKEDYSSALRRFAKLTTGSPSSLVSIF